MKELTTSNVAVINVNQETVNKNERVFPYALNMKRAKTKLLRGGKRTKNMDIEIKTACVNMRFDDGSYHEVVLPILKIWQERLDEEI